MTKGWKIELDKSDNKKWYNIKYPSFTVRVSRYRNTFKGESKEKWHGKSYVDVVDEGANKSFVKLFTKISSANKYAQRFMRANINKHL